MAAAHSPCLRHVRAELRHARMSEICENIGHLQANDSLERCLPVLNVLVTEMCGAKSAHVRIVFGCRRTMGGVLQDVVTSTKLNEDMFNHFQVEIGGSC